MVYEQKIKKSASVPTRAWGCARMSHAPRSLLASPPRLRARSIRRTGKFILQNSALEKDLRRFQILANGLPIDPVSLSFALVADDGADIRRAGACLSAHAEGYGDRPSAKETAASRRPARPNHTRQRKAETSANRRRAVPWSMSIVPVSRWAMSSAPSLCSFVRSRSIASIWRGLEVRIAE
jgi:hypothetical protein